MKQGYLLSVSAGKGLAVATLLFRARTSSVAVGWPAFAIPCPQRFVDWMASVDSLSSWRTMGATLTAFDAVFRFWLDVLAVLLQSWVQVQELIHRQLVFVVDLRAGVVVDILAGHGIVAADNVADMVGLSLFVPSGRLAVVGG